MVIPIVVGTLGTVLERPEKRQEVKTRRRMKTMQTTALLRSVEY